MRTALAVLLCFTFAAPAAAQPNQSLPPGAIKHAGEKCATKIQPPDGQGCPGRPGDRAYCTGAPRAIGECLAAESGFFSPSANFQPRNSIEACINTRENGGSYDRSANPGHAQRWQMTPTLWAAGGGQDDWGYASPGEVDNVFVTFVDSQDPGYRNWRPYDHC